jgi:hypothetical protein
LSAQPEKNTVPLPRVPLMHGSSQKCSAARAAFSVPPAPQKPVRPAARSAPQRRGHSVQEEGTEKAGEIKSAIVSGSFYFKWKNEQ